MGSRPGALLNEVNSLRHPGIQPELLGFLCGLRTFRYRVSSARRGVNVAVGWRCGRDYRAHARHCLGLPPLLCRGHSPELEILLCDPTRFFVFDYDLFDFGGLAFSEASAKLSPPPGRATAPRRNADSREKIQKHYPRKSAANSLALRARCGQDARAP